MLNEQQIALQIAEKVREIATRQGNIPFDKGDLRKSIVVHAQHNNAVIGSNLPYARAVHDGRPALIIRPRHKKRLRFKIKGRWISAKEVHQPARKARPFLRRAVDQLERDGLEFLRPVLERELGDNIAQAIIKAGFKVDRR